MPGLNALYLLLVVALAALAVWRWRVLPFLALLAATALYGLLAGSSLPWVAKEFNMGFGQTLAASGLAVVAGYMLSQAMRDGGAGARLAPLLDGRRGLWAATVLGAMAGLGGTPVAALAVLTPLAESAGKARARISLAITHAVTAGHGCLLPSPLPVAALAILGGDWRWGLAVGLPVALAQLAVGVALAARAPDPVTGHEGLATPPAPLPAVPMRVMVGGVLGMVVMIGLIIGHSLGQIPSEPLGGGNTRENILGLGRPMILLLLGLGGALVLMGALRREAFAADGWLAAGIRRAAPLMLAVGAAGGWQITLYDTGMAPLLAERLEGLPAALGPAIPFLMALLARALQGSALTALITAAGIMQPLLAPLGLAGGAGIALVAVAAGAGAMALPHLNDGFFWLASDQARLGMGQALRRITLGCLAQGAAALAVLMALAPLLR